MSDGYPPPGSLPNDGASRPAASWDGRVPPPSPWADEVAPPALGGAPGATPPPPPPPPRSAALPPYPTQVPAQNPQVAGAQPPSRASLRPPAGAASAAGSPVPAYVQSAGAPAAAPASPVEAPPPSAPAGPAATPRAAEPTAQPRRERNARIGLAESLREDDIDLDEALKAMIELGASDLHLTSGAAPMVRLDGGLRPLEGFPVMYPDALQRALYAVLSVKQREEFEEHLELDLAYAVRGVSRFRVNMYKQRDSIGAAFRMIPYEIRPLEALGVTPAVGNFAGLPRGLVLVTGPTGSGKSTTLAAIIDLANRTRSDHIMTVEDPIEFLHRHKKSLVNQREVGADTHSFAAALKHVLRQDPDIILVGELRDLETISVALTAAETGHLVFGTLHTQDAAQTIDRVIDVFPAHQQEQIRTQLAGALQGVVCQTLCKRASGKGRVVATEVMMATPAIRNLIREGKTHQIYSAMQAGASQGMSTMDQHLAELVRTGKITYEVGLEKCHHVEDFNRLVGRTSRMTQGAGGMAGQASGQAPGQGPAAPPPLPAPKPVVAPHGSGMPR